ncbi:MAG: thymidine phosphorylase [Ignavibacteria bacterium]|nr:thymidine phosphorylase [Ignavibacteria bacterium]
MNPVEIIRKKRDGYELSEYEIKNFIRGYVNGEVSDYQMSALLMAIYFRGLGNEETKFLTEAYIESGRKLNLSKLNKPKVDKHSTGGVGDKTSLILAPLVACFDVIVPMISGRGLGHTGGTLDKLESIPGFRTDLSADEFIKNLESINVCMIGQTDELTPADRKIYALRDVTGTVENISLITASIASKKIAEGTEAVVYDIKCGSGANLSEDKLDELARNLIRTSNEFGQKALAVITDMDSPLGYSVGNWVEVKECVEIMNPKLPVTGLSLDLLEVTLFLAGAMLHLAGEAQSIEDGIKWSGDKLLSGEVFSKFCEMVKLQGGDVEYIHDLNIYPSSEYSRTICADSDGYLARLDALSFGKAAVELGCGRKKTDDTVDHKAGILIRKKPGYEVKKGDVISEIYGSSEDKLDIAQRLLNEGIGISPNPVSFKSKILKVIDSKDI